YKTHEIWFKSLALLRDLGQIPNHRDPVVQSLKTLLEDENRKVRFVVAASLADLGDDSGGEVLVEAYETNIGGISSPDKDIGSWGASYPGRFAYDNWKDSVPTAAYYLARIGDQRGLNHNSADVREAAKEGSLEKKPSSSSSQGFSQESSDDQESPQGGPPVDPTQIENVRQLLGNPDPEERAQGLVQAGILGLDEFYENIKKTALNGDQTERLAAISSLGFYDRPLETEYLNRLIGNDEDLMVKLSTLELATRRQPSRFIDDAIATAHTLSDRFDLDRDENGFLTQGEDEFLVITRILNRMPRPGLPPSMIEGLSDSNPEIRWMMANGFWVGGNPSAVPYLEKIKDDPNPEVKRAVVRALRTLGPPGL
ncbi:MAG: HEAT repeat domain-containing protein, partial [Candidatus Omnitrophica bacterium]|nr:HEAT repeat domain-containing protein [Candidatus Omnitrophota bacterium]